MHACMCVRYMLLLPVHAVLYVVLYTSYGELYPRYDMDGILTRIHHQHKDMQ